METSLFIRARFTALALYLTAAAMPSPSSWSTSPLHRHMIGALTLVQVLNWVSSGRNKKGSGARWCLGVMRVLSANKEVACITSLQTIITCTHAHTPAGCWVISSSRTLQPSRLTLSTSPQQAPRQAYSWLAGHAVHEAAPLDRPARVLAHTHAGAYLMMVRAAQPTANNHVLTKPNTIPSQNLLGHATPPAA